MKDELKEYIVSVSKISEERLENLINNFIKNDLKLTEKMKEENQIEWTKLMNNYKKYCRRNHIKRNNMYIKRVYTHQYFCISQH